MKWPCPCPNIQGVYVKATRKHLFSTTYKLTERKQNIYSTINLHFHNGYTLCIEYIPLHYVVAMFVTQFSSRQEIKKKKKKQIDNEIHSKKIAKENLKINVMINHVNFNILEYISLYIL